MDIDDNDNDLDIDDVLFVRVERPLTGSFMTLKLPRVMKFDMAVKFVERELHAAYAGARWEAINGCLTDPDVMV